MQNSTKHLTAEEVAKKVKAMQPSISTATIYRNINILVEIGILSRLDLHKGPARYELFQGHDHHLVCLHCGAAIKLGICPMQGEIKKIIEEQGFKVNSHHFEVSGYCKACLKTLKDTNFKSRLLVPAFLY